MNQEISIYAKYTGLIEVFVSQGDTVKINEKTYDIRVTDSKPLELSRPDVEQKLSLKDMLMGLHG